MEDDEGNVSFTKSDTCPDGETTCGTYSDFDVDHTANSTWNAAPAAWKTVQGFLGVFDEYAGNNVHIATISYGGHFGPVFGQYFEEQNDAIDQGDLQAQRLDLKTVFIANGWIDPQLQYAGFYNYTTSDPGNTFDYKPLNKTTADNMFNNMYGKGKCWDQIQDCYNKQTNDVCKSADVSVHPTITGSLSPVSYR